MESPKETEGPLLCINNCGFFGSAATMNMCSKCHKDVILKNEQAKLAATSIENIVNGSSSSTKDDTEPIFAVENSSVELKIVPQELTTDLEKKVQGPNRCTTCRKRVGLTGFSCRCGNLFCSVHRYSDKHECPFDYQAAARDSIAKSNPLVKAEKIDKI